MRVLKPFSVFAVFMVFSMNAYSLSQEEELYQKMLANPGVYDDPELTAYVDGLIREVVEVSEIAGQDYTFTLLDSPDVNAFVTDGNFIYVNRGLLNYVQNEAQLVSVLGHEVAHITQNHVSTMPVKAGSAKFLASLAAMLSGSNEVYQAGMAYANSLLMGHGRDNELEADEAGAKYMVALGYEPEAMLNMLTTMKNLEVMQKDLAAKAGAPRRTYHGIFSSHPRSDMRLRSAVAKAERVEKGDPRGSGEDRFREATQGITWGENFKAKVDKPERYADLQKRIRFDFPDGWAHGLEGDGKTVSGEPETADARLSMISGNRTVQGPEEYLYNQLNIPLLKEGREISPARLKGYTGILEGKDGNPDQRIAVIYYKIGAYVFTGSAQNQEAFDANDELFLEAIETFRPITTRELEGKKPMVMKYVRATNRTTFDALGEELKLNHAELQELRVVNGYYPEGEPKAGEWIKIFLLDVEGQELADNVVESGPTP